ncbi:uncharacterized protein LAESUDRAFT_363791 [Laetiporus sulphureus 93-53]|uniref:Uncharacterized protein n=1 Tax=Laetiporus sulphureus 93-53 TaxID=1314785 RepID=A0A165H0D2_9APHY|nr:uncharacterized protein LAESUDRAFT_363791 [Laetiporus sulphureus 93-53]KZT11076.1 hypothetical protein LAESUDRAFT_363791 [Laetiporus sulphureus 93-53]
MSDDENMQILIENLSSSVDYADDQFHRDIYNHIHDNIAPVMSKNSCPSLHVLAYAIHNITKPAFLADRVIDLLSLLAHVNLLRRKAVSQALIALRWNEYYSERSQAGVALMAAEERRLLRKLVLEDGADQNLYRLIRNACAEFDIHNCFLYAPPTMFWSRLQTHFPGQFAGDKGEQSHSHTEIGDNIKTLLFHHDLSEEEQLEDQETAKRCAKFISDAAQIVEAPEKYDASAETVYARISKLFPDPDAELITELVDDYLYKVEALVHAIVRIFDGVDW